MNKKKLLMLGIILSAMFRSVAHAEDIIPDDFKVGDHYIRTTYQGADKSKIKFEDCISGDEAKEGGCIRLGSQEFYQFKMLYNSQGSDGKDITVAALTDVGVLVVTVAGTVAIVYAAPESAFTYYAITAFGTVIAPPALAWLNIGNVYLGWLGVTVAVTGEAAVEDWIVSLFQRRPTLGKQVINYNPASKKAVELIEKDQLASATDKKDVPVPDIATAISQLKDLLLLVDQKYK